MLKTYSYQSLEREDLTQLCQRNTDPDDRIRDQVQAIIQKVRQDGDDALKAYSRQFDGISLNKLYAEKEELEQLAKSLILKEKEALNIAFDNIYKFHSAQLITENPVETSMGVKCWRENRAIDRVGLYVPGGSAVLPSTFLMLGIPAKIAGCKEIIVCSPPQKDGLVNPYLAYCAMLLGIDRIFLAGGAQAIAAMAYGTESLPACNKIFGPGNQFVTMAKSLIQAQSQCAIDMPAGPSEVLIIASEDAIPEFIAADLLAQAEHGADSQAILVSHSEKIIRESLEELNKQLPLLPRAEIAAKALKNSFAMLSSNMEESVEFSNLYAPEHLILATEHWEQLLALISNAGSVFLGNNTPESVGDYASGTNHTLPTSGYARSYSGVSVDSFVKKITFQHLREQGIQNLGPTVEILAGLEGLQAHKNAVSVRLNRLNTFNSTK